MFENFICECPFCKEAAKWPKHNPYTEHNAHEEAVRAALHQAERDNVIKDETIEDLRKKLAKSEEKHKKATKMVKVLMKERDRLNTSLRDRIEKVDELLVNNAELKKTIKGYEGELAKGSYISMSEYDNAIKERNVYKSNSTEDTIISKKSLSTCKKSNEELLNELNKFKEIANNQKGTIDTLNDAIFESQKDHNELRLKFVNERSNREYFQNKFYDKCNECDRLADENEKLRSRRPVIIRAENDGIDLQTFIPKAKYDYLEQKYWDAQRLIDKYAQSEEKTKEYLNALTELYFDECVKTRKDCPMFGGFRGGKIFGDHGETGDSEML